MSGSYMLYCDESGQRDYGKGTDKYFVVSGVMVSDEDATHLEDEIRGFKRALWGNPDIEIKSNWIRQPKEREKHYTQPHGLSGSDINGLLELLIKWIAKAPITFFAGVVDKPGMQSKYPEPHYAGAVAYTMLLQRFQKTLSARSSTGNVIFDDPAGKSPGGHDWRTLLRSQHSKLKRFGCPYTKTKFDDVGSINFADSASSAFVQVADLVAYNTFRQFTHMTHQTPKSFRCTPSLKQFLAHLTAIRPAPLQAGASHTGHQEQKTSGRTSLLPNNSFKPKPLRGSA